MENKHGRFAFMPLSVKSSNIAMENEMMVNYEEGELYIRKDGNNVLIASSKVTSHIYDMNNPHKVTKEQVGLGNVINVEPVPYDTFKKHIDDYENPHKVTKEQVGLSNIKNYGVAELKDFIEGKADKYVTPKSILDYIEEYGLSIGDDEPATPIQNEGTLSFITNPPDAIVSVNINGVWKRGNTHKLPFGAYQYKVEKQGYTSKTGIAMLDMNMVIVKETIYEIEPDYGRLTIISIPTDALIQIQIDGNWVEGSVFDLPYGKYRYKISADGYDSIEGIAIIDSPIVSVSHTLNKIKDPTEPDPDDPIIDDPDPGQIGKNEIYIVNHNQFSDIIIERVNGTDVNMKLIKDEGILTGYKEDELYRLTLVPLNAKYKILFIFINTNTIGKFIEVELEEEEMINLSFKASSNTINKIISYTIKIKTKISSIGPNHARYIDKTIVGSATDIKNINVPKSLYDITVTVQLTNGHNITMKSARTEYLQNIDFLITVNDYVRVELKGYPISNAKVGLFVDKPIARFTTMTIPNKPEAIIETSGGKKYVYIPVDSPLYIIISEDGKMPKITTINDINKDTVIDINNL